MDPEAARLRAEPRSLPRVLTELLRADEATWVSGPAALRGAVPGEPGRPGAPAAAELIVPVGPLRAVRLRRAGLLLMLGRERGLVELRATVLSENTRMRRLLTTLGGRVRRTGDHAIIEVRIRLDGRPTGRAVAVRTGGA